MFEIRSAVKEDVPAIMRFIRDFAAYENSLEEVCVDGQLLELNLFGAHKYAEVILGCSDGNPVAFALFYHNFSTFLGKPGLYIEDLFVIPEERGKGYGKKMLARLAHIAEIRKCGRLEWAVVEWNQAAMNFYLNIGAKPLDEWSVYRVTGRELGDLAALGR